MMFCRSQHLSRFCRLASTSVRIDDKLVPVSNIYCIGRNYGVRALNWNHIAHPNPRINYPNLRINYLIFVFVRHQEHAKELGDKVI